jgi:hypothetical protein
VWDLVSRNTLTSKEILKVIRAAKLPEIYKDLRWSKKYFKQAVKGAKDIRERYGFLNL